MTHFNQVANEWDTPGKVEMMKTLASALRESLDLSGRYSIMDFGCGTGLFGLEFLDQATSLLGVDTSSGMLDVFNKKVSHLDQVESKLIDMETEEFSHRFDLIITSMTFHHLNSPEQMARKLIDNNLNPGGRLVVVDLDQEDGTFHPDNQGMGVKHFGFSKEQLKSWSKGDQFTHSIIYTVSKNDREYPIFMSIYEK
jgi:predicted TPR repeat methyltransferase